MQRIFEVEEDTQAMDADRDIERMDRVQEEATEEALTAYASPFCRMPPVNSGGRFSKNALLPSSPSVLSWVNRAFMPVAWLTLSPSCIHQQCLIEAYSIPKTLSVNSDRDGPSPHHFRGSV